jgi:hypothetical protein
MLGLNTDLAIIILLVMLVCFVKLAVIHEKDELGEIFRSETNRVFYLVIEILLYVDYILIGFFILKYIYLHYIL